MSQIRHIADPLVVARACALLEAEMNRAGFSVHIDGDFEAFRDTRRQVRGGREAPLFDPAVTSLPPERAFWMAVRNGEGTICGLQAFRLDHADPTLGEWALGWVLGIYLKRNELIIPDAVRPAETSISHRLTGPVVYHGELWIDRRVRNRRLVEWFSRLGMLLSLVKWQPAALWALIGNAMATRGHMIRMGYAHMEPGFMRWQFLPEGADPNEWLGLADALSLQRLAEEIVLESAPASTAVILQAQPCVSRSADRKKEAGSRH